MLSSVRINLPVKWLVARRSGSGRIMNTTFVSVTSCSVTAGKSIELDTKARREGDPINISRACQNFWIYYPALPVPLILLLPIDRQGHRKRYEKHCLQFGV